MLDRKSCLCNKFRCTYCCCITQRPCPATLPGDLARRPCHVFTIEPVRLASVFPVFSWPVTTSPYIMFLSTWLGGAVTAYTIRSRLRLYSSTGRLVTYVFAPFGPAFISALTHEMFRSKALEGKLTVIYIPQCIIAL